MAVTKKKSDIVALLLMKNYFCNRILLNTFSIGEVPEW